MSDSHWLRIEEIFHQAAELAPEARSAFLDQACSGDESLRREVESLLAHDAAMGSTFAKAVAEAAAGNITKVEDLSGSNIGPYKVLGRLGAGGMGVVYRASDTRLGRDVAIKVVAERFTRQFEREARAIAAFNHPHICALYDVGPNYLVMEHIEGETLASRIQKGPLPLDVALKIAIEVASALSAAHHKGVIHRDLKPGNIMLSNSGAKLLDFGIAKYHQPVAADVETTTKTLTGDAQVVGTLPYMSPEQLQGKEADARSDIFAFGAVVYEMLTGRGAFKRDSAIDIIAAVSSEEPRPLQELVKSLPSDLERIIRRCLRKRREDRYASTAEIERELEDCRAIASGPVSGMSLKVLYRRSRRPRVAVPALLILLALGSLSAWWLHHNSRARWARDQALPQIAQLTEQGKLGEAYAMAVQAERYIPADPMLVKSWPAISGSGFIRSTPPGASVFRKNYNAPDDAWELVGRAPIEELRMPLVDAQWKFELKGFATVERATFPFHSLMGRMVEEAKAPVGMVHVRFGDSLATVVGLPGFEVLPPLSLGDYWIDKYEVTNRQFKQFLDEGGYRKQEYWKQEFRKDGHALAWAEAMVLFRDTTGRPGPATWAQGEYPRGQDDFPVTGVSWYEAAAYAEFAGKLLPTLYHWAWAARPPDSASIVPASNFAGQGPARVGKYHGMSWCGAYDMAGNVKEWCWNEANSGRRYILGGAWDEPKYMFNAADARSPLQRSANFGFRCAKYTSSGGSAKAADPVTPQTRDFSRERPVSDQVFTVYKSLYSYDKTPLHAVVESAEETVDWKQEKVTFAAAYGHERVIAYLFLPKKASAPLQTVVYFPGSSAIHLRSSAEMQDDIDVFSFLLKSRRAVMFPMYKGTYERGDDLERVVPDTTSSYRDHVIAWSKDLGRSIDYLETRPDIDRSKLAYAGFSWGAAMGLLLPAVEDRIRVCLLFVPGFYLNKCLPEVDQLNFAPRVKVPVLMLNPRFDFIFPTAISQEPAFRLLGTPTEHKRRVVYETGHDIPRNEMIKESLDWLDRYLGLVN